MGRRLETEDGGNGEVPGRPAGTRHLGRVDPWGTLEPGQCRTREEKGVGV